MTATIKSAVNFSLAMTTTVVYIAIIDSSRFLVATSTKIITVDAKCILANAG